MRKILRLLVIVGFSVTLTGCVEETRVPLPTPLTTVGGARPKLNQGFQLVAEFGDGVWGQEQERAEMVGAGLGVALFGRAEVEYMNFTPTKRVRSEDSGTTHAGEDADLVRGKFLVKDFEAQRLSVGVHLAMSGSERVAADVQDESLRSVDFALPVEFSWVRAPAGTRGSAMKELSLFAGPRMIHQSLDDHRARDSESGTLWAINLGLKSRLSYVSLVGELNLAWTPEMELGGIRSQADFIILPMAGLRVLIPVG